MAFTDRAFTRNISRARGLFRAHDSLHGKRGKPRREVSDILRGGLTLAMAALDAHVTDSIAAAIPDFARAGRLGRRVVDFATEHPAAVVGAFATANPAGQLRDSIDKMKLEWSTHQRPSAIDKALKGYLNVKMDWQAVAVRCNAAGVAGKKDWDAAKVRTRLEEFVERRNKIVHEGDLMDGTLRASGIRIGYVREAVDLVEIVGCAVSDAIKSATP